MIPLLAALISLDSPFKFFSFSRYASEKIFSRIPQIASIYSLFILCLYFSHVTHVFFVLTSIYPSWGLGGISNIYSTGTPMPICTVFPKCPFSQLLPLLQVFYHLFYLHLSRFLHWPMFRPLHAGGAGCAGYLSRETCSAAQKCYCQGKEFHKLIFGLGALGL